MIYILIVLGIFVIDNKIKKYIEDNKPMYKKEKIWKGNIIIERYHNKGAMLNFLEDKVEVVKLISTSLVGILCIIFSIVITVRKENSLLKLGLSLVLGGALSNVYDRHKKGYVVDYFSFKFLKKIVFNISDICIIIGSAAIALHSLTKKN